MKTVFCMLLLVLLTASVRSKIKETDKAALETLRNIMSDVGSKLEKGVEKGKGFAEELDQFIKKASDKVGALLKPVQSFIEFLKSVAGKVSGTSTEAKKTIAKELKTLQEQAKHLEIRDVEVNVPGFIISAKNKLKSLTDRIVNKVG